MWACWVFMSQTIYYNNIYINYNWIKKKLLRNDMSITFLQQILSGRLLLVIIVGAKK